MSEILLHLFKANLALVLLYGLYFLALRRLTFYNFNRAYLWFTVLFSAVYPALDLTWFSQQKPTFLPALPSPSVYWPQPEAFPVASENIIDYGEVAILLFCTGAALMFVRLLVQFFSLYRLHRKSKPSKVQHIPFRKVAEQISPFSFGRNIYLNPAPFEAQELKLILEHEQVHVKQAHTLDVLLAELLTVFGWLNPMAWKMRQSIKENLEFIADRQLLHKGADRKIYQYSLLRAVSPSSLLVVHPFNAIPLKNRIMMMNQPQSTRSHLLKSLLALPLIAGLLLFSGTDSLSEIPEKLQSTAQQAVAVAQQQSTPAKKKQEVKSSSSPAANKEKATTKFTPPVVKRDKQTVKFMPPVVKKDEEPVQEKQDLPADYKAFLKRNPSVKRLTWANETLSIHLKSGKTEQYPSTVKGMAAAEKKYGKLPALPAPPPPAPPAPDAPQAKLPPPPPFTTDLPQEFKERNPTVKGLSSDEGTLYVIFKSGEVESFDQTPEGRTAFEKKFGTLPPPPPPVRVKKDLPPPPPPTRNKLN
ncbi:M56 family metallopeptidase [Rufibacter roseus]|uniref:M56 family metallopeptidase n=1 Tax=Rufibacter roseus TaxID=1567108 RepID=A0ABW2DMM1_9BACT|nr:M56 family metallopeptidase [Rufibacter roseus]